MQERQRNLQKKCDAGVKVLFWPLNLFLFFYVLVAIAWSDAYTIQYPNRHMTSRPPY